MNFISNLFKSKKMEENINLNQEIPQNVNNNNNSDSYSSEEIYNQNININQNNNYYIPKLQDQNDSYSEEEIYQQQETKQVSIPTYSQSRSKSSKGKVRLISGDDSADKELTAVIVTTSEGGSYDSLFESVKQEPEEGTKVSVYFCPPSYMKMLTDYFSLELNPTEERTKDATLDRMLKEVDILDGDCVLFNFECCGGCNYKAFMGQESTSFPYFKALLDRGFVLMFGDFSMKYLVTNWSVEHLGANPFVKVGEYSSNVKIKYDRETLINSVSTQLEKLAKLSEDKAEAHVNAMGGTFAYSIDNRVRDPQYRLELLTIATKLDGKSTKKYYDERPEIKCVVNLEEGIACHTAIHYHNRGVILTSSSHWIELSQFKVSKERMEEEFMEQGEEVYANYKSGLERCVNEVETEQYIQQVSNNYVQKSMPCQNKSRKMKMSNLSKK